jgi:large subunit ribosomal protein L7/L12
VPVETWDVVLVDAGPNVIGLIRELREATAKDLRDLEALVGAVPNTLQGGLARGDADRLRERIEAAGGQVEVRRATAG